MSEQTHGHHAFGFQAGTWNVRHRQVRRRLAGNQEWLEFNGTCWARDLLCGAGNVDDHWIDSPLGAYAAATLRRLEPDGIWSIWWIDSRRDGLDPPMRGWFENDIGTFFGRDQYLGKPIDVRFIWSRLTEASPRWEQAFSPDGGMTWETNWVMDFDRA